MLTKNRPFRIRLVATANDSRAFRRTGRRRLGQRMPLMQRAERVNLDARPIGNASAGESNTLAAYAGRLYAVVAT